MTGAVPVAAPRRASWRSAGDHRTDASHDALQGATQPVDPRFRWKARQPAALAATFRPYPARRSRKALETTSTLDAAMAPAASIGDSRRPVTG